MKLKSAVPIIGDDEVKWLVIESDTLEAANMMHGITKENW